MRTLLWPYAGGLPLLALTAVLAAPNGEFTVTFHDPKTDVAAIVLPVETNQRIQLQYVGMMGFGLTVDGKMLCCGAGAIRTNFKIDDAIIFPNNPGNPVKP